MKIITFSLLTLLAGAAATAARAEHRVHVGISVTPAPVYHPAPAYAPAPAYCPPTPVVVAPAYSPVYTPVVAPRGYWRDETVKTWIPGRYTTGRDRWGRPVRVFEPGHYAYTTNRVWVDGRNDRHAHRHDNRHDNRGGRWGR